MASEPTQRGGKHVLIIGGGIAGLAAALRVRALDPANRVTIVDAAARLGGKIAGEVVAGCVVDGGADVCIGDKLRSTHLFADLALAPRVIPVNPNGLPTYERRDGKLQRAPSSFQGELLTFPHGMQEMVDVACAALSDVALVTDTSIESISIADRTWQAQAAGDTSFIADAVILAAPATSCAALFASLAPHQATDLSTLEYPPTTTVTMAWRSSDVPRPLDGTGYLVVDATSQVTACTWTSSKNPSHAAPGIALLRGYVQGTGGDAAALMRKEVEETLGITGLPLFTRIYEWPAGIPSYTPLHEANVHALQDALDTTPGIFIAGSAFHGIGVPDCIDSGERAGAAAVAYLAAPPAGDAT